MTTKDAAASLAPLAEVLGHGFEHPELLVEALTHPSARTRRGGAKRGYERLEFLGDRVLGLIIAELLWRGFPDEAEGALTRRHTSLVRRETLTGIANTCEFSSRSIFRSSSPLVCDLAGDGIVVQLGRPNRWHSRGRLNWRSRRWFSQGGLFALCRSRIELG